MMDLLTCQLRLLLRCKKTALLLGLLLASSLLDDSFGGMLSGRLCSLWTWSRSVAPLRLSWKHLEEMGKATL